MKSIILSFREGRVPRVRNVWSLLRAIAPQNGRARQPAKSGPALMLFRLHRAVICLFLLPFAFLTPVAPAQIQQAWVARYNNSILNGTNEAIKMALDPTGNIYVSGFSQNTSTNLGYVTIKYAPNGNLLWIARYDDTNFPAATPSAIALDPSNNVVVTGNALTVKYDLNGNELWTAPYDGVAIAMDKVGNALVTGMQSSFSTVKINAAGSNLWQVTYSDPTGPASSQIVLVDSVNNIYVSGFETYYCFRGGCYVELMTIKYSEGGSQLWTATYNPGGPISSVKVRGAELDIAGNLYLTPNFDIGGEPGSAVTRISSSGVVSWSTFLEGPWSAYGGFALTLDQHSNTIAAGGTAYAINGSNYYTIISLNMAGTPSWTNHYPETPSGSSSVSSIAVDSANNAYVTGYSPGTNGTNDIATIKYDPNGNMVWLQRYSSPGGGNAAGNAIAVDNNGNVYVTGYDTTAAGGTEIVTIKYSPVTLQRRSDGTVILQAQGSPGESFDIEASQDLLNWLDLGTFLADTNGLLQFDDTNAPNYSSRFYYASPQ